MNKVNLLINNILSSHSNFYIIFGKSPIVGEIKSKKRKKRYFCRSKDDQYVKKGIIDVIFSFLNFDTKNLRSILNMYVCTLESTNNKNIVF